MQSAHGYVRPDISKGLREIPEVKQLEMRGFLGSAFDIRTETRRCGPNSRR